MARSGAFQRVGEYPPPDASHPSANVPVAQDQFRRIVAIDFGTTFSSVAYTRIYKDETREDILMIQDIKCIRNYPGDRVIANSVAAQEPREDVPSEIWYPPPQPTGRARRPAASDEPADVPMSDADAPIVEDDIDNVETLVYYDDSPEPEPLTGTMPTPAQSSEYMHPFWGFQVQRRLREVDIPNFRSVRIQRFKLLLDEKTKETQKLRASLRSTLWDLKRRTKYIKKDTDVIKDYLTQLFKHTQAELKDSPDFGPGQPIEFVLCVPAVWPSKACRIMQAAMTEAAEKSNMAGSDGKGLESLFIISEPEAAATCVLAENLNDVYAGETIAILDAGGGTVDGVTYQVTQSRPLRLSSEVVSPGTKLCGSSYINEEFERLLLDKLKNESYLERNGKTIRSIVEAKVIEFENEEKRTLDVIRGRWRMDPIYIDDLRPDPTRGFAQNRIELTREEVQKLYEPSLIGATEVLKEQLEGAEKKGCRVQVLLIGGFGQSPSLRSNLEGYLARKKRKDGLQIDLLLPGFPATSVARGAVLRASDKAKGPKRELECSYGFLRTEPYEPDRFPAHKGTKVSIDKADGERYIKNTIRWMFTKGTTLESRQTKWLQVIHTFKSSTKELLCREEVYVSDNFHESHYKISHEKNEGAELAGAIELDMSFLLHEGKIEPMRPSVFSTKKNINDLHYEVIFDLFMEVEGRSMKYYANWPSTKDESQDGIPTRKGEGQISIAAAFRPGTE